MQAFTSRAQCAPSRCVDLPKNRVWLLRCKTGSSEIDSEDRPLSRVAFRRQSLHARLRHFAAFRGVQLSRHRTSYTKTID